MAQNNAERSSSGRTALGGASCGFTYDAAMLDAVARENRLRRPLRLKHWQHDAPRAATPVEARRHEQPQAERAVPSPVN